MLISAIRTKDIFEMCVINTRSHDADLSKINADKGIYSISNVNNNNNNNNNNTSRNTTVTSRDDLLDINSSHSRSDSLDQLKLITSHSNVPGRLKYLNNINDRGLSGSVPTLATGLN
jgi:hypothetical protein